jgi:hypothetical protein
MAWNTISFQLTHDMPTHKKMVMLLTSSAPNFTLSELLHFWWKVVQMLHAIDSLLSTYSIQHLTLTCFNVTYSSSQHITTHFSTSESQPGSSSAPSPKHSDASSFHQPHLSAQQQLALTDIYAPPRIQPSTAVADASVVAENVSVSQKSSPALVKSLAQA